MVAGIWNHVLKFDIHISLYFVLKRFLKAKNKVEKVGALLFGLPHTYWSCIH